MSNEELRCGASVGLLIWTNCDGTDGGLDVSPVASDMGEEKRKKV